MKVYCLAAEPHQVPRDPSSSPRWGLNYNTAERDYHLFDSRRGLLKIPERLVFLGRGDFREALSAPPVKTARIRLTPRSPGYRSVLHIGTRSFGFVELFRDIKDYKRFRRALPMPCTRLASFLSVEEIRNLEGKIPEDVRSELLAAKLKET
jgi:hypothetical protein